jgi:hypothetical protein
MFEGVTEGSVVRVYDALGRVISEMRATVWNVPPGVEAGSYEVVLEGPQGERWMGHVTIQP